MTASLIVFYFPYIFQNGPSCRNSIDTILKVTRAGVCCLRGSPFCVLPTHSSQASTCPACPASPPGRRIHVISHTERKSRRLEKAQARELSCRNASPDISSQLLRLRLR